MWRACCLLILVGCTNTPYHPIFGDAGTDAAEDAGSDASEEPSPPVQYGNLCCKQAGVTQPCTLDPNPWECVPDPNQPFSYECAGGTLCAVGQYCVGIDGPGTVIDCAAR